MAVHPLDTSEQFATQAFLYEWLAVPTGDTGEPIEVNTFVDLCVQVDGTFGGATVTMEGSNGPASAPVYSPLTDPTTTPIAVSSADLVQITEAPRYIRPNIAAGAGASINIRLVARRAAR